MPKTKTHGLPAKQPRSQETLESLLLAAEELIEERDYTEVSMSDVADRAGRAVGSLYSRIGSKDELMLCLYHRYLCSTEKLIGEFVEGRNWRGVGLKARIEASVSLLVDNYKRRRGIVKALNHQPMPADREAQYRPRVSRLFDSIARLLSEAPDVQPRGGLASVEFSLLIVVATARGRIVEGADSGITKSISMTVLKRELSRVLWLYLASDSKGARS